MTARDRSTSDSVAAKSGEVLGLLRRLREGFELEIRNLESSSEAPQSTASQAKVHDSSLYERRYERLLRLRRIQAKLHNRERVLIEGPVGQE
jgi:hypothetical protein